MAVSQKKNGSRFKQLRDKFRHGLLLHGIKNKLADLGITIDPFYWVQEGLGELAEPKIKGDASGYSVSYFGPEEIKVIDQDRKSGEYESILQDLQRGQLCIGLKHNGQPVAQMLVHLKDLEFGRKTIPLAKNEAYLINMYTIKSYRGKGLAPFLRYHSYQLLKERGIDTWFSVSEAFNKATIRFKQKLNSKHLQLWVHINLFGKFDRYFLVRKYV